MSAIALRPATSLASPPTPFGAHVLRLSQASVRKHFDAYEDVDWESPDNVIDCADPRFELVVDDPLGGTDWYRGLPQQMRARLGLHLVARHMQVGIHFEGILSQGLLAFAATLPAKAPELRYALHEVVEEGQHSLMFREFVARTGLEVHGIRGIRRRLANRVPAMARTFPELFFIHVLAGEAPIDAIQRRELERGQGLHPLLCRIMRIHVTEEARHMSFAESYLRERVPQLSAAARLSMAIQTPFALASTADQMTHLPADLAALYNVPRHVVRSAFRGNAERRRRTAESLVTVAALCRELGILHGGTAWLWRRLGLLLDSEPRLPAG